MGRPTEAITYEQATQYESSHIKWLNVCGYITNIKELADDVFQIPHCTALNRLKAGWPLEAAFVADKNQRWSKSNVMFLQSQPSTKLKFELMVTSYFEKRQSRSPTTEEKVINGGYF